MTRAMVVAWVLAASAAVHAEPFETPTRVMRCTPMATDPTPIGTVEIFRVGHSDLGLVVVTTSSQKAGTTSFAHLVVSTDRHHDARYLQALQTTGDRDVQIGFNLVARVGHNQEATFQQPWGNHMTQDVRLVCDSEPALATDQVSVPGFMIPRGSSSARSARR